MATKPSTQVRGNTSVAPRQISEGQSLAKDLTGLLGSANQFKQTNDEVTSKFAKRQAVDSRNQLKLELSAIESTITPDTDESVTQQLIQDAYMKHDNGDSVINSAARDAYDSLYTIPMGEAVANMNAKLEVKKTERVSLETRNYVEMSLENTMILGDFQDVDGRKMFNEQYTVNGYKTNSEGDAKQVEIINASFLTEQTSIGKLLSENGYSPEEGVTQKVMDRTFNNRYNSFGEMQDGSIQWKDDVDAKSKNGILKAWGSFNSDVSKLGAGDINLKLQEHNNKVGDDVSAAESGTLTSIQQQMNLEFNRKSIDELNSPSADVQLTKSQKESTYKKLNKEEIALAKTQHLEKMMKSDKDTFMTLMQNGGEVEVDGRKVKYSKEFIKNVINGQQAIVSEELSNAAVGEDASGKNPFNEALIKAKELTNITGEKNVLVQSYYNNVTGGGVFSSVEDIEKSTYAAKQSVIDGTSNELVKNVAFTSALDRVNQRRANGEFNSDQDYVDAANATMRKMRSTIYSSVNKESMRRIFDKSRQAGIDAGAFTIDTDISSSTIDALMYRFAALGIQDMSEENVAKFITDNTIAFAGTWTSLANSFSPVGDRASSGMTLNDSSGNKLKTKVYEDSVSNLVDSYNDKHPNSTIDVSDVRIQSYYDGGKNESEGGWRVMFKDDNDALQPLGSNDGRYNGSQLTVWAGKVTEELKQRRFYSNTIANIATTKGK